MLGICNGFQVLCEAGLLPGALLLNEDLRFICRQVDLRRGSEGLQRGGRRRSRSRSSTAKGVTRPREVLDELEAEGRSSTATRRARTRTVPRATSPGSRNEAATCRPDAPPRARRRPADRVRRRPGGSSRGSPGGPSGDQPPRRRPERSGCRPFPRSASETPASHRLRGRGFGGCREPGIRGRRLRFEGTFRSSPLLAITVQQSRKPALFAF